MAEQRQVGAAAKVGLGIGALVVGALIAKARIDDTPQHTAMQSAPAPNGYQRLAQRDPVTSAFIAKLMPELATLGADHKHASESGFERVTVYAPKSDGCGLLRAWLNSAAPPDCLIIGCAAAGVDDWTIVGYHSAWQQIDGAGYMPDCALK